MRRDGLLASYHPDFMVCTATHIYIIETKGDDRVADANVRQKQVAAVEWCHKINSLLPVERMEREWVYVLLPESDFYSLARNGAMLDDICHLHWVSRANAMGKLF